MALAFCIGCGCSDHDACENEETGEPCSWLAVDYAARSGVCSECPEHLPIWPKEDAPLDHKGSEATTSPQSVDAQHDAGGDPPRP